MLKEKICSTRYPILLVHGAFFRDVNWLSYWGRIPNLLQQNGAQVYFGCQQSAESVEDAAAFLADRIRAIVAETGCEKLNVIAHSKGGLDMRWAIAHCGIAGQVASLTTVSTPHRGCRYVDHLLTRLPKWLLHTVAALYNGTMRLMGEKSPDFMAAAKDLSAAVCEPRDKALAEPQGIVCRSIGTCLKKGAGAKGLLRLTCHWVKGYDGPNDGLVGTHSMGWGKSFHLLEPKGKKGISHWDATDLHRRTIKGTDMAAYYLNMVAELKERGL